MNDDDALEKDSDNFMFSPEVDDNNYKHLHVNPALVEMPRKAKLFRVVVDRKLGIDWEHTVKSSEENSLQTYQVLEGYDECNRSSAMTRNSQNLKTFLFNKSEVKDNRKSESINSDIVVPKEPN